MQTAVFDDHGQRGSPALPAAKSRHSFDLFGGRDGRTERENAATHRKKRRFSHRIESQSPPERVFVSPAARQKPFSMAGRVIFGANGPLQGNFRAASRNSLTHNLESRVLLIAHLPYCFGVQSAIGVLIL